MSKPKIPPAVPASQPASRSNAPAETPASASPLEQLPMTHHAVACALAKAEAALALFRLAEEHYDGEDFEFMTMICTNVIAEELAAAKAAYAKAVGDKTVVTS